MEKLIVDAPLSSKLTGPLELCDESGRSLGYFIPSPDQAQDAYERAKSKFTPQQIRQALAEPDGRTTQEILADLARRAPQ